MSSAGARTGAGWAPKFHLHRGCDSGFGHELARQLGEMGALVFAGVLDVHGAGAQKLREGTSGRLHVLQLDVTDDEHIQATRRYICTRAGGTGEGQGGGGPGGQGEPVLMGLCCRALGFGQQRRDPSVSCRRRAAANRRLQALHGRELPGSREDVSGVPPAAEEVQRTHRQRVQHGRWADGCVGWLPQAEAFCVPQARFQCRCSPLTEPPRRRWPSTQR